MREFVRPGLMALVVLGVTAAASTQAQQTTPKAAPPPAMAKGAAPARPSIPGLEQPVATVNGEVITKGDLINFLSKYQLPPVGPEQIYRDAVETLINTRLVGQYLSRLGTPVDETKINQEIVQLEKQLKADGTSLAAALLESNTTMDDLKKELATRQRWVDYVKTKATDAELKKFVATHKDLFNGTQVRASHILLKVDPKTTPADKEKVRQKLLGIKQDIESGRISFAEAANKFSEDPANAEGAGGDLGYFGLNSGFIEEFANAAFAMKKGQISDPVETIYGYHLIQVTDRKEGQPIDFEQQRPLVQHMYATELQKEVLTAERKTAKIDIKPMPPDLFPPAPVGTPTTTPASGNAPAPKADTTKNAAPK
jgi:parvulin-like peptidyl-prolyl isomerase